MQIIYRHMIELALKRINERFNSSFLFLVHFVHYKSVHINFIVHISITNITAKNLQKNMKY